MLLGRGGDVVNVGCQKVRREDDGQIASNADFSLFEMWLVFVCLTSHVLSGGARHWLGG